MLRAVTVNKIVRYRIEKHMSKKRKRTRLRYTLPFPSAHKKEHSGSEKHKEEMEDVRVGIQFILDHDEIMRNLAGK